MRANLALLALMFLAFMAWPVNGNLDRATVYLAAAIVVIAMPRKQP